VLAILCVGFMFDHNLATHQLMLILRCDYMSVNQLVSEKKRVFLGKNSFFASLDTEVT